MITAIVIIAINEKGEYLLHLRDDQTPRLKNQWCLIGGKIEGTESAIEGAVREMVEETSFTLLEPKQVDVIHDQHRTVAVIVGLVDTDREEMVLGEGAELRFFGKEELLNHISSLDYTNPYLEVLVEYANQR